MKLEQRSGQSSLKKNINKSVINYYILFFTTKENVKVAKENLTSIS